MALKFKQEVNLFLDLYIESVENTLTKAVIKDQVFYGNRAIMYNDFLINYEKTKEIINTLNIIDISKPFSEMLSETWNIHKLEDFERYAKVDKNDYVAVEWKWIQLKLYKSICKMLEEFNNISLHVGDFIKFYEWETLLIIVAPYKLDAQTNLFDNED